MKSCLTTRTSGKESWLGDQHAVILVHRLAYAGMPIRLTHSCGHSARFASTTAPHVLRVLSSQSCARCTARMEVIAS